MSCVNYSDISQFVKRLAITVFVVSLLLASIVTRSSHRAAGIFQPMHSTTTLQSTSSQRTSSSEPPTKPKLILHVGPSKSATTSLQTDLTSLQPFLEADGFSYGGRYYNPFINDNGNFDLGRSESHLLTTAHNMLKHCNFNEQSRVECCRNFTLDLLNYPHRGNQRNIILSEEPFGNQWRDTEDWKAIRDVVADDFDVMVIVGYRRFYQWLPSAHFQRDRTDRNGPVKNPWPSQGGRPLSALFPWFWENWGRFFAYSADILDAIGDTFPVRIINLHNDEHQSPLTTLVCDFLGEEMVHSCEESRKRDRNPTVMNTETNKTSLFYDAIATDLANKGLIDVDRWNRTEIREAIREYHEEVLGLEPDDLPLRCPDPGQLNLFLNMSLALEASCVPDFANDTLHYQAHVAGFQDYVDRNKYCWVDVDELAEIEEWNAFLVPFQ